MVALELLENENVVNIFTFPEKIATEEFYKQMSEQWKNDVDIEFPEGFSKIERKLSVSDSLLPDEIRVERPDLITRAQAEWHFVVLSSKLYGLYKSELEEFKDKVETLTDYDNKIWEELKISGIKSSIRSMIEIYSENMPLPSEKEQMVF